MVVGFKTLKIDSLLNKSYLFSIKNILKTFNLPAEAHNLRFIIIGILNCLNYYFIA